MCRDAAVHPAGCGPGTPEAALERAAERGPVRVRCRRGGSVPSQRRVLINWQEQRVSAAARITAAGISVGRGLGASGASPEWI